MILIYIKYLSIYLYKADEPKSQCRQNKAKI